MPTPGDHPQRRKQPRCAVEAKRCKDFDKGGWIHWTMIRELHEADRHPSSLFQPESGWSVMRLGPWLGQALLANE